ncbi:hypothetical protein FOPG_18020 [Fusarium oxysporum f. sp. conglutinans race 2 54008]|uniref:Uncharacterized protein n=2 Tax=Fusarium oxysporum TaxID=5507 RepID=A0A0J9VZ49_FUSO4|nr:hypothetical protein FOXG_21474 [Fusarium oxysporum f. sp. lycopersici 4287]EWZ77297.1 hypothetical protein FOWG_18282 [Fusarium oxysporum f. sp. lycopersici MN25]EXL65777.1 hypothetical protein FOPG_18020 [Fusarium oxysporum f. sp. conglutinans race 2 54008]KAI8416368.1 hypothetical protein FOFC_02677 [Fusarium oxysporum]KAJ9413522.1 hypothetical protein QL093DRAFT_2478673 [Fusarium oxysporum]KNB15770.1 hypothetical protein FOXG_21474 [Fusarium oxysporum f. sp. lycopersici 4287]
MYFGDNEDADYQERLPHLSQEQLGALDPFIELRMRQGKERKLVQGSEEDAKAELCKVMV